MAMKMQKQASPIDRYLASVPRDQRDALERLRRIVREMAPDAEERIAYGVAALYWNKKPLAGFGAAAHHCAFYPMSGAIVDAHRGQLKRFSTSKGTIRFTPDQPLPVTLVKKLVRARMTEIKTKAGG